MSKKDRRKDAVAGEKTEKVMGIDAILAQLASMKDNAKSSLHTPIDKDFDDVWLADVAACEAATAILSALQDEGIADPEGVRDLVHDYNALAEQYRKMHQQYEQPEKPQTIGAAKVYVCPKCHRPSRPGNNYCWNCGKRLDWGR